MLNISASQYAMVFILILGLIFSLSNIVLIYLEVPEHHVILWLMLNFNLLLFLELVKKFGVVVLKPIYLF